MIELLKEAFIRTVVAQRGDRLLASPAELAEARLYLGMEAARIGLIDALGTDADAVEKAASLAGISSYGLVNINEKVARQFIEQQRRLDASLGDDGELGLSGVGKLRSLATLSQQSRDLPGLPDGFSTDSNLPKMYYLYVTPPSE
jgi:ClpP class serine protease